MGSWLREPLLHFALLGALVFGIYRWAGPRPVDATLITITPPLQADIAAKFRDAVQREPTAKELEELIEGWVAKEVLYREGLAMGLDRSDGRVREIIIANMQALVRAQSVPDAPSDAELRQWFAARRGQYDQPQRFDFAQLLFADGAADGEAQAQLASHALAGASADDGLYRQLRSYRDRPREWVAKTFGEAFARELERQPAGEWRAVRSSRGWHAVRLDAVHPPRTASFEALKDDLEIEWRRDRELWLAAETLRTMRARYTVVRTPRE